MGKRGRPRGFYARGMPGPGEAAESGPEEWVEEMVGVVKARVAAMVSARPEDVRLLLRSAEAVLRAMLTERRLSGRSERDLAQNIQRVLDSLGSQLLPADGPGGPESS